MSTTEHDRAVAFRGRYLPLLHVLILAAEVPVPIELECKAVDLRRHYSSFVHLRADIDAHGQTRLLASLTPAGLLATSYHLGLLYLATPNGSHINTDRRCLRALCLHRL